MPGGRSWPTFDAASSELSSGLSSAIPDRFPHGFLHSGASSARKMAKRHRNLRHRNSCADKVFFTLLPLPSGATGPTRARRARRADARQGDPPFQPRPTAKPESPTNFGMAGRFRASWQVAEPPLGVPPYAGFGMAGRFRASRQVAEPPLGVPPYAGCPRRAGTSPQPSEQHIGTIAPGKWRNLRAEFRLTRTRGLSPVSPGSRP